MLHYASNQHHISLKINTLEVWCYQCIKWVGKRGKFRAEEERVDAIVKHFTKSKSPTIQSLQHHTTTRPATLGTRNFLLAWRKFLLGNEMPPEEINNQSLVVAREDYAYLMNPYMAPFHDFGIISETSWKTLCKFYKGGPAMSEDNIPKDNPVYFPLLEEIAAGKQRIIEQCKTRKPNAKSVVPISTSATFSNYQQLPSSL
ncbi:hypothetical protein BCR33DRAFT_721654 [Rhizoclosmatium globosum]|uniref:Uncharacterized protein n=1 Tax=Rhizoclosmatium globosum TaxID=329046 RepID=A0A1Y2BQH6_9FUNG|nr:hypothetical protein BCR33DRAFT_721654 [Rhizoclosmatium globosum]|eukprot:ORY36998.1 hypothetical protein BCR33DRAFT_721654 [Rhizoclosmatium globosum]